MAAPNNDRITVVGGESSDKIKEIKVFEWFLARRGRVGYGDMYDNEGFEVGLAYPHPLKEDELTFLNKSELSDIISALETARDSL